MKTPPPAWLRLVATARRAPVETRDDTAPHGFATRVAARALAADRPAAPSLFARFALPALGVSCLLALACVAASWRPVAEAIEMETAALHEGLAMDLDGLDLS